MQYGEAHHCGDSMWCVYYCHCRKTTLTLVTAATAATVTACKLWTQMHFFLKKEEYFSINITQFLYAVNLFILVQKRKWLKRWNAMRKREQDLKMLLKHLRIIQFGVCRVSVFLLYAITCTQSTFYCFLSSFFCCIFCFYIRIHKYENAHISPIRSHGKGHFWLVYLGFCFFWFSVCHFINTHTCTYTR